MLTSFPVEMQPFISLKNLRFIILNNTIKVLGSRAYKYIYTKSVNIIINKSLKLGRRAKLKFEITDEESMKISMHCGRQKGKI